MAEIPPLPPGFTLDAAPSGGIPPLPPGFTLDSGPAEPSEATAVDRAGAVAAGFNRGVAATAGLPVDTAQNVLDLGKIIPGLIAAQVNKRPGEVIRLKNGRQMFDLDENGELVPSRTPDTTDIPNALQVPDRAQVLGSGQYIADKLDQGSQALTGQTVTQIPRPDDAASRVLYAAGTGIPSAVLTPGRPVMPAVAGATGGASAQLAAEAGAPQEVQLAAGLVGSTVPSLARVSVAEGARRLARGGEQGRQRVAQNIQTFDDAGTTPTIGQATEGRLARATESLLSRTPGSAGRVANKAELQGDEIGTRVEQLAAKLSPRASGEQAGRQIQQGVKGESGFVANFKKRQEALYDELDKHIPANKPVTISETRNTLRAINPDIEGAPNTSKLFQNSRIKGIESAVERDLELAPKAAQEKLSQTLSKIDELYASRNAARQEAGKFAAYENNQGNAANNFSPVPGMPRAPKRYTPHEANRAEGRSAAQDANWIADMRAREARDLEATVNDLRSSVEAAGGKLPYEALKKLRTLVGREMADSSVMSDVPRSKWKSLYGALSSDLEAAAKTAGPQATSAYNRANTFTRAGMKRLEVLDGVVDKAGGPEAVYRAATSGSKEGASTLRAVMQSLPEDAKRTLSASVMRRMGRATSGRQDDLGEKFSTETFLTNWNSMSPQAKAALFDRYGKGFRQDMDSIARVASNMREGSAVFRNPSGTGQAVAQTSAAVGIITALAAGSPATAGAIVAGAGGANLAARVMANPKAVQWLAKTTKASRSALPALINQAANSDDEDLRELAALLKNQPKN